jgi:hypothetical protein
MVLRMASNNQEPIRLGIKQNRVTHNIGLELTGILLQWLVLEHVVDTSTLRDASVSIWCDNLPAVAWMYKFHTSTSLVATWILRALTVRLHTNRAALLSVEHISGIYNTMADVAS